MLLIELFDRLATGELSQHKIGKTGKVLPDDYGAIIHQLNLALTNLHSYFPLMESEVVIQQFEEITEYQLNSKYSISKDDPNIPKKWIIDSEFRPFLDNVIRINSAYDEVGNQIPLNDEYSEDSVFTSAWDTIQIPYPVATNSISVLYLANHKKIATDADPLTTEISLPAVLEAALQAKIASRLFVTLMSEVSAGLASHYNSEYAKQIAHVERYNLLHNTDADSNTKLQQKGFV